MKIIIWIESFTKAEQAFWHQTILPRKNISRIKFSGTTPTTQILLYTGLVLYMHIHILNYKKKKTNPFCWSHAVLKVAARSPYLKITVLKIEKGRQGWISADFCLAKCWAPVRSLVKMTLQGPSLASGVPVSETMLGFRHCEQLERQQGMLLIGIKGTGRVG